jgi:hypothetical protein
MHETNTLSRVPTDMDMVRRRDYHLENEIPATFRGTRSAFGATFEAADKFGWTLVHPVSANPNPSGIVTDAARTAVSRGSPRMSKSSLSHLSDQTFFASLPSFRSSSSSKRGAGHDL